MVELRSQRVQFLCFFLSLFCSCSLVLCRTIQTTTSSFTVKLYSRDTLEPSQIKNSRQVALARLKRDSARVKFLFNDTILVAAGKAASSSDLNQMDLDTPVSSGLGEYFARFGFGTPAKQLYLVVDTGSDVTWIQCKPCDQCYSQRDPIFDPSISQSYKPLTCDSQPCLQLDPPDCSETTNTCLYELGYLDGSVTTGDFATETLSFDGNMNIPNVAIGCGRYNKVIFHDAAGIFGLGRGSLSFPSQLKSSSFSYCLVDVYSASTSTLEFGGSSNSDDAAAVTTQLILNSQHPSFYYVCLTGISVAGEMLPFPPSVFEIMKPSGHGGVIVDSGTTLTYFVNDVYQKLRDEFVKGSNMLPLDGSFGGFDTCFEASVVTPTVAFHFGAQTLALPSNNCLLQVDSNTVCFAFAAISGPNMIIGNIQQQGMRVTFDVGNSLIRFSPSKC